jgi:NhaC family Na+:H+ antiporter
MQNKATLPESLALMIIIVGFIAICVNLGLSLVVPLFLCWLIMCLFCLYKKNNWREYESFGLQAIRDGFQSVMIVMAVGVLIGSWILSGTVPTIIYYGLLSINPSWFLPATLLLCSMLSLATGTSYGSAGSAGLAMMGIGISMGFPPGMIAGAVICGALFGDKMSPFSDTTNLCPAMAGGELFKHIGSMMWTTLPVWLLCFGLFGLLGRRYGGADYDPTIVINYMEALQANFNISVTTLIPLILIIVLLIFKTPALPTILIGAVVGGITAMAVQGASFSQVIQVMHKGFTIQTGVDLVDRLLNRGGVNSMNDVVMIMTFGMGLGGILEKSGVLSSFLGLFVHTITSTGRLIVATLGVTYLSGAIGCTMSMAQVISGKLMAPIFREKGIAPEILSRTMEDAGTLGGTLMPWHTNAVFFTGVLGVTYQQYIPFVFLCYLTPLFSLLYGFTGWTLKFIDPKTGEYVSKPSSLQI